MSVVNRLLTIMSQLRDPQRGCPWDKEQSFTSLVPHTLEEAYEVADAIERRDFSDLEEELGDLLYQIVFYCQLAKEQQLFNFDDVCRAISDKLVRRHPHVFSNQTESDLSIDRQRWESVKHQEREQKKRFSVLDDIPLAFPALMRAEKIQKRCATVGFDWQSLAPVVDKVREEIDEVLYEVNQSIPDQQKLQEEVGDLLFAVVNLSRHLGVRAEEALSQANIKFERRFRQVEQLIEQQGKSINSSTLDEKEACWQQVKNNEINNQSY